jgi:hypothetical protein
MTAGSVGGDSIDDFWAATGEGEEFAGITLTRSCQPSLSPSSSIIDSTSSQSSAALHNIFFSGFGP